MAFFPLIYFSQYQQLTGLLQMHPFDFPSKNHPAPGQQDKAYAPGHVRPSPSGSSFCSKLSSLRIFMSHLSYASTNFLVPSVHYTHPCLCAIEHSLFVPIMSSLPFTNSFSSSLRKPKLTLNSPSPWLP